MSVVVAAPEEGSGKDDEQVATLVRGAGISLVGRVGGRMLHVAGEVLLARTLGPALFGLYAIGWILVRVVGLIAPVGTDKGVVRFGAAYWGTDRRRLSAVVFQSLFTASAVGLLVGVSCFVFASEIATSIFDKPGLAPVLRGFAPAFVLVALLRVSAAATRVTQRMQYAALAEDLCQTATNFLLICLVAVMGWGLSGAVAAATLSFAAGVALAFFYIRRLYPGIHPRDVLVEGSYHRLIAFSVPASGASVSMLLILWTDRLILSGFRPAGEVGIYQAVSQPAFVFSTAIGAFGAIFAPMIARLASQGELARVEALFRVSTKWALYLPMPLFLVLCYAPSGFIQTLYGAEYVAGVWPMLLLSGAQLVNAGTGSVGHLLMMTGHQRQWMVISLGMLAMNVTLSLVLIPRYGMLGAAVASAVTVAGLFVGGLFEVRRSLRLWPYDRRFAKGLAAAVVAFGTLHLVGSMTEASSGSVFVLYLATTTIVFLAMLKLLGFDAEDRVLLQTLRRRVTK